MQLEAGCLGHVHGQGARAVARRRPARADDRAPAGKGKRAETVDLSAVVGSGSPEGISTLMSKFMASWLLTFPLALVPSVHSQ